MKTKLYIDVTRYITKDMVKTQQQFYARGNEESFRKYLLEYFNTDYAVNKESWEARREGRFNIVCLDDANLPIAEVLAHCLNKLDASTEIIKQWNYTPEDKVTKLLDCVQAELWTIADRVLETPTDAMIEYYAERLRKEYQAGNISDTQYIILSKGIGVFEQYIERSFTVDELTQDADFGFYVDMTTTTEVY